MTSSLITPPVRCILLDIEGTTTPISFVHEVLFSYARSQVRNYLVDHYESAETVADVAKLRAEHASDVEQNLRPPELVVGRRNAEIDSLVAYVNWLIDRDRKSAGLKSLQGRIWREGYVEGTLKAPLFSDVAPALERWHRDGLRIAIFSSGSVLAQRLLFAHTEAGDLTGFIDNYFDTSQGPKIELESYHRIAAALSLPAQDVLFISDVVNELDAARAAGMQTRLCVRPGNHDQSHPERYQNIQTFDDISILNATT
ncbi:MAG: acireductone synthase [Pyrinomonadaceae bacterium]|nr:acireductone synthase [Pyrinomonadaceae bacterium]